MVDAEGVRPSGKCRRKTGAGWAWEIRVGSFIISTNLSVEKRGRAGAFLWPWGLSRGTGCTPLGLFSCKVGCGQ